MMIHLDALEELEKILNELTSRPSGRRAFLASVPLLLGACATTVPQHRQREGNNVKTEMTPDDERKMTQEALPEMRKQYPAVENPEMQNYISNLGITLAKANGLEGNPYHYNFTVVGVPYVNAFALPAGTVFVTAPLIAMADTEAELAGVVGHEIGHVKSKHTAQRMEKAKKEQGKSWLYGAGGGLLGGAAGFGLGKLLCKQDDRSCLLKATALGAAAGVGGGLLIQKFAFMANSREDEMEADRIGFRTSVNALYDKEQAGAFYSKLFKMEQENKQKSGGGAGGFSALNDALSTHPPSQERVNQMKQLAAETKNAPGAKTSSKEFDRVKQLSIEWVKAHPPETKKG